MVGLNELAKQVAPPRGASWGVSGVHPTASRDRAPSARANLPPVRRWPLWAARAFACLYWALSATADLSEPIKPIPADVGTDPAKAALGRMLFHDIRLSKDNTISCASCHDLPTGGDDGKVVSLGVAEARGAINSPTVYNAAFNFKQFWDGRADTLHQQSDGPVQSAIEMASLWPDVLGKLYQDDQYPALFEALYPDGITRPNAKDAIAEFLRSLTTPNSPFDRWLSGDGAAITEHERQGYELFKFYGCVSCHQGAAVGGNMFQVFGVINEYFKRRGNITEAPYLHDGSAATLRDAVDAMFEFQLGRDAPEEDKEAIVAFIKTLAGESEELAQ